MGPTFLEFILSFFRWKIIFYWSSPKLRESSCMYQPVALVHCQFRDIKKSPMYATIPICSTSKPKPFQVEVRWGAVPLYNHHTSHVLYTWLQYPPSLGHPASSSRRTCDNAGQKAKVLRSFMVTTTNSIDLPSATTSGRTADQLTAAMDHPHLCSSQPTAAGMSMVRSLALKPKEKASTRSKRDG